MIKTLILFSCFFSFHSVAQNACIGFDQKYHIYGGNTQFVDSWERCGSESWGNAISATQCLLQSYPNQLSKTCASCFGEHIGCVRNNCWWHCIWNHGESCKRCALDSCMKPLEACSGLPESQLPSRP